MRALTVIHRWLGVALCLFFAMWFATGIVMHFVPFPALTESERIAGLAPIDPASVRHAPAAAVAASGVRDATRVRVIARPDGPVYVVHGDSGLAALHAGDLSSAAVRSERVAVDIAAGHARRRGLDAARAHLAGRASHDQWSVPNGLDPHRPLYRVALDDDAGSELYVSSVTGEVVLDTTRRERAWNYAGSVMHWIYPTALRRHSRVWDRTVWTLSLVAFIAACSGALLGVLRLQRSGGRIVSPYRGWHAWHHWLGIACMAFVLTWIFSGWLSMDRGRLFSTGKLSAAEASALLGTPAWDAAQAIAGAATEVEWFAFGGRVYRRTLGAAADFSKSETNPAFGIAAVTAAAARLSSDCKPAVVVEPADAYAMASSTPGAPVYRSICGGLWLHVDGANGALLEKLDASRRAYRWLYSALHTLDFPALAARPGLRTTLVVILCGSGFAFAVTATVIGWRRLRGRHRRCIGCCAARDHAAGPGTP